MSNLRCSYGDGHILGVTKSTELQADMGTVIQVAPTGLHVKDDGSLAWNTAEVRKVLEDGKPDSGEAIRKLVRKEGN